MVPGTSLGAQVFPCLLRLWDHRLSKPVLVAEISIDLNGPVTHFTVLQDLERGWVQVWGDTPQGFFRYRLIGDTQRSGVMLFLEKAPKDRLEIMDRGTRHALGPKELFPIAFEPPESQFYNAPLTDRLALGNHKAQDWDLVYRRGDLKEILPAWFRLGQLLPIPENFTGSSYTGSLKLLHRCREVISQGKPEHIAQSFINLFKAGFEGILTPRIYDDQYQGLSTGHESLGNEDSPLYLLAGAVPLIRSLFVEESSDEIRILPHCPPEFSCGRHLHVPVQGGFIDIEWTKKSIRRLIYYSLQSQQLNISFGPHIKQFRLRKRGEVRGREIKCGIPLLLESHSDYFFDNFR